MCRLPMSLVVKVACDWVFVSGGGYITVRFNHSCNVVKAQLSILERILTKDLVALF